MVYLNKSLIYILNFKNKNKMKKLVFILLKITEVLLAFIVIGTVAWLLGFFEFIEWVNKLLGVVVFILIDLSIIVLCFINLSRMGFFKKWFDVNKEWSQNIVNWIKRDKE